MAADARRRIFRRLKALAHSSGPLGRDVQALALHALDLNQLTKLAKPSARARSDRGP
jgi:hypothetical protein